MKAPDSVHQLAARGMHIIPLRCNSKSPAISDWPNQASTDPAQIDHWGEQLPNCNWGIVTGPASGVWVLDVDDEAGLTSLKELCRQYGTAAFSTLTIKTAHGGFHLYFRWNDTTPVHTGAGLLPGIDTRGVGGQAVAPGSVIDGVTYTATTGLDAPIIEAVYIPQPKAQPPEPLDDDDDFGDDDSRFPRGERNSRLTSLAGVLRNRGANQDEIQTFLLATNRRRCRPPLPESEVSTIARSVSRYAVPPEVDTGQPADDQLPEQFKVRSWEDIPDIRTRVRVPTEFLVEDIVPLNQITEIAALYSVGKTHLALMLARAVRTGGEFLGRPVKQRDLVIYLDRENPESEIQDRFAVLYDDSDPAHLHWGLWLEDPPPSIEDPRYEDFAREGAVLIFDSRIRFHGADENSATEMAAVNLRFRRLQNLGATVIILSHCNKAGKTRGTTEIPSAVDVLYEMKANGDGTLTMTAEKNRPGVLSPFTFRPDWGNGTAVPAVSEEYEKRAEAVAVLQKIIDDNPGQTESAICKELTRQTAASQSSGRRYLECHTGKRWRMEKEVGLRQPRRYFPLVIDLNKRKTEVVEITTSPSYSPAPPLLKREGGPGNEEEGEDGAKPIGIAPPGTPAVPPAKPADPPHVVPSQGGPRPRGRKPNGSDPEGWASCPRCGALALWDPAVAKNVCLAQCEAKP